MQSENKLCVVLLFGGMSSEHEVSRVSVGNFVNNIDRTKYEVLAVGITKEGRWLYTEATAAQMADGSWEELAGNMPCILSPDRMGHGADHHIRQSAHRRRIPRRHAVLLPTCRLHLAVRPDTGPSRPAHSSRPLVRHSHSF